MVNALATKATLADPALTGTATAANLTVNAGGNLKVGTTNIMTEVGLKQSTIVTTETGHICTSMGNNKRIVSTIDNKMKFQTFDNDGKP